MTRSGVPLDLLSLLGLIAYLANNAASPKALIEQYQIKIYPFERFKCDSTVILYTGLNSLMIFFKIKKPL